MNNIYTSGEYLKATKTWHAEDSHWKAVQIGEFIRSNNLRPKRIGEIGCGAGVVLDELSKRADLQDVHFTGYDISPQAIDFAKRLNNKQIDFFCEDPLVETNRNRFDILLVIDVFEHVPDYMGFLERCRAKAEYKIYHIPLEISVSSVLRNTFTQCRYTLGHLHYFSENSALATLKDTGHEILGSVYTDAAFGLFGEHRTLKRATANVLRWILSKFSLPIAARTLGGYSLLVLAR